MRYLLNSPVLAIPGTYEYRECLDAERTLYREATSAVGHPGTAEVMTGILGFDVKPNRVYVVLEPGDSALVFQLTERLPEGKVLSAEELLRLKYTLRILIRIH